MLCLIPDEFNLPTSDNEADVELDNFLISPNDNPLPLIPNRGHLDPTSNWLQSSSENDSDPDHDQFLLNADDLYCDDAWSYYSDTDTQGNNTVNDNDFEINDQYIDDDLEHYFLDSEGLNLMNPFGIPNDQANEEDPEPSPGPFDPG